MGAPKVFRWDDVDAPVLAGDGTRLIDLLDACLVNGYGTKDPLGWTKEFASLGGGDAVYRNNPLAGTGFFFQFETEYSVSYPGRVWRFCGFETMTALGTGTGKFPDGIVYDYVYASTLVTADPRAWVLIGDDQGFYLKVWHNIATASFTATTDDGPTIYVGDVIPHDPLDAFASGCFGQYSETYDSDLGTLLPGSGTTKIGQVMARNLAGDVGAHAVGVYSGGGPGSTTGMGSIGAPHPFAGQTLITRPSINDGLAYSHRGFFPGLWYPCHQYPFDNLVEADVGGVNFMPFHTEIGGNLHGQMLIDLDITFRP